MTGQEKGDHLIQVTA